MTFEQSIIIPLELYQKCRLDEADSSLDILLDNTMPADKKLKLYNQSTLTKRTDEIPNIRDTSVMVGDHILHNIPDKDRPVARAILDVFRAHPSELGWTDNGEVIINSDTIPNSSLINILLYFTKNLPVTSQIDVPLGARRLYEKLISLDMPSSWVKRKPVAAPRLGRSSTVPAILTSDRVSPVEESSTEKTRKRPARKRRKLEHAENIPRLTKGVTWEAL